MTQASLSWLQIARLGLAQASLGALVVLTTSTMNRVMVVELALPAILPASLVALHYALQALRPRWGYGADMSGRRTPWIVGGVALLALGCVGAALSICLMGSHRFVGVCVATACFSLIGIGVGASGTSILALLAAEVAPARRAAAATVVWIMMIAGFVVTTATVGHYLDPYSPGRLVAATLLVAVLSVIFSTIAVWRIEKPAARPRPAPGLFGNARAAPSFRQTLAEVMAEPETRAFARFVFVAMLAYSAEELILDPFSGAVFGFSPGASTKLSGVLHSGVLVGMIVVALAGHRFAGTRLGSLRLWAIGGCLASGLALVSLAFAAISGRAWPLQSSVLFLGAANGAFSIAAIGSMMALAGKGRPGREGTRMGLWGASQGVAFALGGIIVSLASDLARSVMPTQGQAYAMVFAGEAALFVFAAAIAARMNAGASSKGFALDGPGKQASVAAPLSGGVAQW
jgi:BCD family chlorophyll transporter-like MFS transporter